MTTNRTLAKINGPQAPQVEALIARAATLTAEEVTLLAAVGDADWAAAWVAAVIAAEDAAGNADRSAVDAAVEATVEAGAWDAVRAAALAVAVRGFIDQAHYDTLTAPWRSVIGPLHPDDAPPATTN